MSRIENVNRADFDMEYNVSKIKMCVLLRSLIGISVPLYNMVLTYTKFTVGYVTTVFHIKRAIHEILSIPFVIR